MKRITFFTGLILLSLTIHSSARQRSLAAYDSETLTVSSTAVGFTSSHITASTPSSSNNADVATFTVNCASGTACVIRFKIDGQTPTTSNGLRAFYGDTVTVTGRPAVLAWKGIREITTDVIIDAQYFHYQ